MNRSGPFTLLISTALTFALLMTGCGDSTGPGSSSGNRYKMTSHLIDTQLPSYVNIMFQVTDMDDIGVDYLTTADFIVTEDNLPVSPTESFLQVQKKDTVPYTLKTVLLLDNSMSVSGNLAEIKAAAVTLVENIENQQEFAIYEFSDEPVLRQDFTSDVAALTLAINEIQIGYNSTNLYGAVIEGVSRWEDFYSIPEIEQGFLVLFTDGSDTQGSHQLSEALAARGSKRVYTIGLGNEIEPAALETLGNSGSYLISDLSELLNRFTLIQEEMALYANSFYWLNYLSPRQGDSNHILRVSIVLNDFHGLESFIEGSFNSADFYSVNQDVYLYRQGQYDEVIDELHVMENDTLYLEALTYFYENPPVYDWTVMDTDLAWLDHPAGINETARLIILGDGNNQTSLILTDTANNHSRTIPLFITAPPNPDLFDYGTTYNDHTYWVSREARNWVDARNACELENGHLITIGSADENHVAAQLAESIHANCWMGFTDIESEGNWVWVTNEPVVFTNWDEGDPDNSNNQDAAVIFGTGSNIGLWNDVQTSINAYFILEKE